ncbi:MAG: glucose-6-phosphate dehydrogenase [Euryarchaeota archaeon]|nr:glucose-6-phosphate dehydrogenase [Euryarchaeota archaeon]MDE1880789.1 glucose-6-phosphate dehydrogenase [Euryarchaeota archaeon]
MRRKLLPALYHLHARGDIPAGSGILAVARAPLDDAKFQQVALDALLAAGAGTDGAQDRANLEQWCARTIRFQSLAAGGSAGYAALSARIPQVEKELGLAGDRLFYLALPLQAFASTIQGLGDAGLAHGPGWTRVVVEKPFGRDLASAQQLNALLHRYFEEQQVYRIDHYLGKETVQNLLVLRFANAFIESDWNREHVEDVQITVAESLGVEDRAGYYESSGALRDMVQNHTTQVLSLVAMEPPGSLDADAIRNEKVKLLRSIAPLAPGDVVFGQYQAGGIGGQSVPGYRQEPGVSPTSDVETFVALRLRIANWRWQGVPFYLRTGKRLPAKSTRVVVTFRAPPVAFFHRAAAYEMSPDRLTILLQPDEGFELCFEVKVPGREMRTQTHRMSFRYSDVFGSLSDGYEMLLMDVLRGDPTHFVRADEVEASWTLYDPLLANRPPVRPYAAGTMGPAEADQLLEEMGHRWDESGLSGGS